MSTASHQRAYELAQHGLSTRKIAAQLRAEGHQASHASVAKWLKQHDEEGREVARREVATQARTSIGDASAALAELIRLGMPLARKAAEEGECRDFQAVAMAIEKCSNTLHKYAELATKGQERPVDPEQVAARVMAIYGLRPPEPKPVTH